MARFGGGRNIHTHMQVHVLWASTMLLGFFHSWLTSESIEEINAAIWIPDLLCPKLHQLDADTSYILAGLPIVNGLLDRPSAQIVGSPSQINGDGSFVAPLQ